ncbi:MAG: hypothetical protein ACK2TV_00465 [Anaerolineales bacterium]
MPWPVTHILIATKLFDEYFGHLNYQKFILGTSFPDIRYPAKIERKRTHFRHLKLSEIQSQSAFQAGLQFHSMTDGMWNGYIHSHARILDTIIPHNQAMLHTMKILQDVYLYEKSSNWQNIADLFETILPEEYTFGVNQRMVKLWHRRLTDYLRKPPNIGDLKMLTISLPSDLIDNIANYFQAYQDDLSLNQILSDFYDAAEMILMRG